LDRDEEFLGVKARGVGTSKGGRDGVLVNAGVGGVEESDTGRLGVEGGNDESGLTACVGYEMGRSLGEHDEVTGIELTGVVGGTVLVERAGQKWRSSNVQKSFGGSGVVVGCDLEMSVVTLGSIRDAARTGLPFRRDR
jgi:hypothetical protein